MTGFQGSLYHRVSTVFFTGSKSYQQVYQQFVDNIIFYPVKPVEWGKRHYCHKYIKSYPQVQQKKSVKKSFAVVSLGIL